MLHVCDSQRPLERDIGVPLRYGAWRGGGEGTCLSKRTLLETLPELTGEEPLSEGGDEYNLDEQADEGFDRCYCRQSCV